MATSCYSSTRIALFKFHTVLLSNLQLDPSSSSFHSRLMKQALGSASLVLDTKTPVLASSQSKESNMNADALGKKGKKRARGAGEEVVVAGIEGRGGKGLSRLEGEVVLSALRRESCCDLLGWQEGAGNDLTLQYQ